MKLKFTRKKRKPILFVLVILFGIIVTIISQIDSRESVTVAYVGRYGKITDSKSDSTRTVKFQGLHEFGLNRYIDKYNETSKVKIKLETFSNNNNANSTKLVYDSIAKREDIVAVIDNTWGEEILAASDVIKKNKLPVISINADKNGIDYGNSVLFTGNIDKQTIMSMGSYIKKALKINTINFISETSEYNNKKYLSAFDTLDITIQNRLVLSTKKVPSDSIINKDLDQLLSNKHLTIINSHEKIGTYIVNYVNNFHSGETLFGHATILSYGSDVNYNDKNRIILLSQSENSASKEVIEGVNKYKSIHKSNDTIDNGINVSLFMKRCLDAWNILETTSKDSISGENFSRENFKRRFKALSNAGFQTSSDYLFFDKSKTLIRENRFIEDGVSLPRQINTIDSIIPNIEIGIEIIDIQNVNLRSNSFESDFYYWINSSTPIDSLGNILTFHNIRPSESTKDLITTTVTKDNEYRLYKVSGKFFKEYNVRDYPFDSQEISIDIQLLHPSEELKVSYDKESLNQDLTRIKLRDWETVKSLVTVDNVVTKKLKGNLELAKNKINKFENISFRVYISRSRLPGLLQIVLPLFLIGIIAIGLLFLKNLDFSNIGDSLGAVFLTVIAFSISLTDISPVGGALTKTDLLFMTTLSTVVLCYFIGLFLNYKNGLNVKRIKGFRIILLISYIGIFLYFSLFH